ncbi:protein of unknown function DUF192 [Spirochaeta thermophila DSM 6578]|uniref:DUF192 domain-containing protein n=1 Tax=Winmispira thermophila (strain ATCC 700085 / DSM 6578 / Z-1203) TaxID=869211 RepID=G0GCW3_WINT7|nr:DUF192 domain-containing protein [Spirochaeta thermophila]AEJ61255.1 protein of unknown function DUF192 [Spirochaeta thermophila DSM 6578]
MKRSWISFKAASLVLALSVLFGCGGGEMAHIRIDGISLKVEVADTPAERERGLMGRMTLAPYDGMLFVFPRAYRAAFWMKDTPLPLSVAFIDEAGVIREIHHLVPFSTVPVQASVPVRYALEVEEGFFDMHGIRAGDVVHLPERLRQ